MFSRTEALLGDAAMKQLKHSRVAVFGVGGVGGYVAEALIRSGIGSIDLIDDDVVSESNLNRQIIALHSTIGKPKVEVMKDRLLDINPEAEVTARRMFFLPENKEQIPFQEFDYVIDAVDTITAKLSLISCAKAAGVLVISSMGAGNKLNPAGFLVADIYQTEICPLARVMRRELRKRDIHDLKVVYSKEPPVSTGIIPEEHRIVEDELQKNDALRSGKQKKLVPGSIAFVPAAAGLLIASEVVKDLCRMG